MPLKPLEKLLNSTTWIDTALQWTTAQVETRVPLSDSIHEFSSFITQLDTPSPSTSVPHEFSLTMHFFRNISLLSRKREVNIKNFNYLKNSRKYKVYGKYKYPKNNFKKKIIFFAVDFIINLTSVLIRRICLKRNLKSCFLLGKFIF